MVALGWGSSPVDVVPATLPPSGALPDAVAALIDLPGARYVLVVDASGERVRGELGGPPDADLAVLTWARRLADVSRERGRAMEDVVLTTATAFHLVRAVPDVRGEPVWVVLRIDRERGNLALARRALAGLSSERPGTTRPRQLEAAPVPPTSSAGPATGSLPAAMPLAGRPVPLAPAPRPASDPVRPATGPGVPALALLPPTPAPRALRSPEAVPPPPASGAVRTPDVSDGPLPTPDAATPEPASGAVRTPDVSDGPVLTPAETPADTETPDEDPPGLWDPRRRRLTVRQAATWRSAPEVPAARESTERAEPAAPVIPAPRVAGSLFAPVVVVPPPPSPVDDDTTEVPAPVPYPVITAPPLEPTPEPEPAPAEEPAVTDAGLPRRAPGERLAVPPVPPEAVAPAPAPAGVPGWSTEPSVLRRLLFGLRRLT
ncbi:hypothetical protein WCD74_02655 [Actinomycetospora sp. OC33-EN08]|uniref:Roadblock/LAMTOR2 domain-containing protein n=1 Tax=Actinomycetospora aurantiaca TaxID=3129233 RepID=A0ABU8MJM9_9PSEU